MNFIKTHFEDSPFRTEEFDHTLELFTAEGVAQTYYLRPNDAYLMHQFYIDEAVDHIVYHEVSVTDGVVIRNDMFSYFNA